jgi:hypothetical protein
MTPSLEGVEWSAAPLGRTLPQERPGTHFTGGWVGPRTGLDGRKISSSPGFDPGPSSPQSVTIPTELPGPHLNTCIVRKKYHPTTTNSTAFLDSERLWYVEILRHREQKDVMKKMNVWTSFTITDYLNCMISLLYWYYYLLSFCKRQNVFWSINTENSLVGGKQNSTISPCVTGMY